MSATCTSCGSDKIIPNARVIDHEDGYELDLNVEVYEAPDDPLEKRGRYGKVRARICGDCGHATVFVTDAAKLWETYLRSRKES